MLNSLDGAIFSKLIGRIDLSLNPLVSVRVCFFFSVFICTLTWPFFLYARNYFLRGYWLLVTFHYFHFYLSLKKWTYIRLRIKYIWGSLWVRIIFYVSVTFSSFLHRDQVQYSNVDVSRAKFHKKVLVVLSNTLRKVNGLNSALETKQGSFDTFKIHLYFSFIK